jgi:hypothetical protein
MIEIKMMKKIDILVLCCLFIGMPLLEAMYQAKCVIILPAQTACQDSSPNEESYLYIKSSEEKFITENPTFKATTERPDSLCRMAKVAFLPETLTQLSAFAENIQEKRFCAWCGYVSNGELVITPNRMPEDENNIIISGNDNWRKILAQHRLIHLESSSSLNGSSSLQDNRLLGKIYIHPRESFTDKQSQESPPPLKNPGPSTQTPTFEISQKPQQPGPTNQNTNKKMDGRVCSLMLVETSDQDHPENKNFHFQINTSSTAFAQAYPYLQPSENAADSPHRTGRADLSPANKRQLQEFLQEAIKNGVFQLNGSLSGSQLTINNKTETKPYNKTILIDSGLQKILQHHSTIYLMGKENVIILFMDGSNSSPNPLNNPPLPVVENGFSDEEINEIPQYKNTPQPQPNPNSGIPIETTLQKTILKKLFVLVGAIGLGAALMTFLLEKGYGDLIASFFTQK